MLHQSILPVHRQFSRILSNLRYVVVDEGHAYRCAQAAASMHRQCNFNIVALAVLQGACFISFHFSNSLTFMHIETVSKSSFRLQSLYVRCARGRLPWLRLHSHHRALLCSGGACCFTGACLGVTQLWSCAACGGCVIGSTAQTPALSSPVPPLPTLTAMPQTCLVRCSHLRVEWGQ